MKNGAVTTLAMAFVLLIVAQGKAADLSPQGRSAVETIRSEQIYSLGGVGFVGSLTAGRKALDTLRSGDDPTDVDAALLTVLRDSRASTVARMYALAGLRSVTERDTAPDRWFSVHETITTARGCLISTQSAREVARQIIGGRVDTPVVSMTFLSERMAVADLRRADTFSVGPLGPQTKRSPGETALRRLLTGRRGFVLAELNRLVADATASRPVRLYALVALRALRVVAPEAALTSLRRDETPVRTQSGSGVEDLPPRVIAKCISDGYYDVAWSQALER